MAETKLREDWARLTNELSAQRNQLIADTLGYLTGVEFSSDPREIWTWWDNYNETEYQRSKFARRQYLARTYAATFRDPTELDVLSVRIAS